MKKAKYNQETREWLEKLLDGKTLDEKIKILEIKERQKYNYYIDCSNRWTTEQNRKYESEWNEIIDMLNELKTEKEA